MHATVKNVGTGMAEHLANLDWQLQDAKYEGDLELINKLTLEFNQLHDLATSEQIAEYERLMNEY